MFYIGGMQFLVKIYFVKEISKAELFMFAFNFQKIVIFQSDFVFLILSNWHIHETLGLSINLKSS